MSRMQWWDEIHKHSTGLRVFVYQGQNQQPGDFHTDPAAAAHVKRRRVRHGGQVPSGAKGAGRRRSGSKRKVSPDSEGEGEGVVEEEEDIKSANEGGEQDGLQGGGVRSGREVFDPASHPSHLVCASDLARADIVLTTYGKEGCVHGRILHVSCAQRTVMCMHCQHALSCAQRMYCHVHALPACTVCTAHVLSACTVCTARMYFGRINASFIAQEIRLSDSALCEAPLAQQFETSSVIS